MEKINVLWIEDQSESPLCKPFKLQASLKGLNLIAKEDWESGRNYLESHKDSISAIVLDCYCKLHKDDQENEQFLANAISEIESFTEKYQKLFPWFVLSAGSRDSFASIIRYSLTNKREKWDKEWQKVYYSKLNEDEDIKHLIENVIRVSSLDKDYQIREKHSNVIRVLDSELFDRGASAILTKILKPLHFPEEQINFDALLHYNQLRQFIEKIFRACYNQGLLPDECMKEGEVNLWESYNYISGNTLKYSPIRFGEEGESLLPQHYARTISQILFITNEMSHSEYVELTEDDKTKVRKYLEETGATYYLYGYALQLCDIVIWFSNYCKIHDFHVNRAKIRLLKNKNNNESKSTQDNRTLEELIEAYKGKTFLITKDQDGNVVCGGKCVLQPIHAGFADKGIQAILTEVMPNTISKTKDKYPLFCPKFERVNSSKPKQ